ncbi:MAG: glycosyltransferase [Salinivirgaceae bacterium]|nr:glycosyltransferase [Salinivirgaceae bacterium]MBR6310520.1 glycosyltransferase [Paludibacteraceae bacterium]
MNILVITQHIFPIQSPRSIRSTELIKELARRGHSVTVYAVLGKYDYADFQRETSIKVMPIPICWELFPNNSDGSGRRTLIDKILGRLLRKFEFPLFEFYFRIAKIIRNEAAADVLISIADPHPIHWGCARAKAKYPEKFPKTWIADCGDPFMKNGTTKEHLPFFARYEKMFCKACDYITVPIENAKDAYYPEFRDKIRVIPQGFDFDLNAVGKSAPKNDVPTFAFAGMFYADIRNPKLLLEYLSTVQKDFRFVVYTRFNSLLVDYTDRLKEKLIVRQPIQRTELIDVLKTMDFLVNIKNANSPNQLPSKLIDYGIAGRPILDVDPQNPNYAQIDAFLNGDYSTALKITNLEQYHIGNVAAKFEELFNTKR